MQRAGVACTDCHTAHAAKDPVLVKATQPQICFTCHAGQPRRQLTSTRTTRSAKARWCAATATTRMAVPGDTKDAEGIHRQRDLLQLPRRQARADAVGASAGARQLPELPHAARLEPAAPDEGADELPLLFLPQRVKPIAAAVRSAAGMALCAVPAAARPGFNAGSVFFNSALANQRQLRQLPLAGPRVEQPGRRLLLPLMRRHEQGGSI